MSPTVDQELAELRRANAELLRERDAALAALAQRNTEYGERIEYQAATIDVLKAMSASPGDPQPVFDLIARQAAKLCNVPVAAVAILDGTVLHLATQSGFDAAIVDAYTSQFPRPVGPDFSMGRAILNRRIDQVEDLASDPGHSFGHLLGHWSVIAVPMLRDDKPLGAMVLGRPPAGPFSQSQIALLQTFAEQAVIAMTSAETYRALQTRTADLQESLEYQTATSNVLKVISRSAFDLQPILDTVVETAARLCDADQAIINRREGVGLRLAANFGFPPEYEAHFRSHGLVSVDEHTASARAASERRPVHIHDVTTVPGYPEAPILLGKQRTSLGVPLLREEEVIGTIVLARRRVEPFTDRQIDLVSTFADQAVIAIENTRLITEQREALEQQTATAEVLQVINANPGDLTPVFDTMLERALRLCGVAFGSLATFDGEFVHHVTDRGLPLVLREFAVQPFRPEPGSALFRLAHGEHLVHLADITDDDAYRLGVPSRRALADVGGARTALWIALRKEDALLGMMMLCRTEVREFSENEINLLENFAAQAVIAMENARLLTEQREALEQQIATAEVLQVINASPGDLVPVFEAILDKAHGLCGAVVGSLLIYDGERFHAEATHGQPEEVSAILSRPFRPNIFLRRLVLGEHLVHIPDFKAASVQEDHELTRSTRSSTDIRTSLWVPLRKDGQLLGCISAFRLEVRPFSEREIALLENFAAQAVIAMENARLLNEVRQRQEELRITFENMGDGVAMFDGTQHLVAWNGKFQEVFDLPNALLKQHRTYEEYLRFLAERGDFGTGVNTADQIHQLVTTTGQPYGYERTRPDGRVIEIRRNPVPDGGFVLIFSDITERKRSEAEIRAARDAAEAAYRDLKTAQASLIQAEKMASLGQLTAGIAHEIKNPLNFVNNFATLSVDLLDEIKQTAAPGLEVLDEARRAELDDLTSTLASNLDKINEHGRRADGIVRSMLEHSRGSSGERRSVDLNTLVDEALNLAYHGARARDQSFTIRLEREFGEGIAKITLAPQDITRVLLNLFSNGFYAARERQRAETTSGFEPTLKVATRELDGAVEIRVRDNGIGIPSEIKDRLFQPFFTTKPTGEGTGLGLSMSYDIVTQQHGGNITVDSEVGEFSEFAVRLPRSP
jgi:two-component system, NtrC family, sensor kinase